MVNGAPGQLAVCVKSNKLNFERNKYQHTFTYRNILSTKTCEIYLNKNHTLHRSHIIN